jgi:ketosteroid isomerase-like protein
MSAETNAELIRTSCNCWVSGDRATLESILADDFTFTSPNDDHLNKAQYWEVCWANQDQIGDIDIEVILTDERQGFIRYVGQQKDGSRFRNTEYYEFEGGKIKSVDVYFGRSLNEEH